jgi:hypothetical protein
LDFRELFSRKEIDYFFKDLFVNEKKYEKKFFKKYFKKVSRAITHHMYPAFHRVYPKYVQQGMVNPHKSLTDMFELKVYTVQKIFLK